METIPALLVSVAIAVAAFLGGLKLISLLDETAYPSGQANARQRVFEHFQLSGSDEDAR
jgi:hypothetical protein